MAEEVENVSQNADTLELDLDELDDKEFDLPPVECPPTLESILNEPDDDSPLQEDYLAAGSLLQGDAADTGSISSAEGILGDKPRKRNKKSIRYDQHGSILRHVVLKGASAQLMSAADRVDAGRPTAMAVSSLIAVGTSHGVVLVFDPQQVLKWCLGSTAVGRQYGAVSALSFNRDCTRLLSGFAKGQITMWDLTNGKLLRTITDTHPPGTAILHVKFTDDLTIAVTSDSGGSVFELEFRRLIGVRTCESRCLFSGSRGEVCTIEPLHLNHTIQDHPMRDTLILAMGSLSKVLIVTIRPQLKVICMHPLKGDPATLPLLAWQFVIIQVSERDRVIDPVLAFGRDQTIHFLQVVCNSPDDIKVAPLQQTTLPYKLLSITWLNSRTMVVLDTSERAHVIDVRTEEELEVLDLADVQLVYSTSFYKSLATGGNVSKALAYAGERACYQSIVGYNSQLVFLGTKGIHVMTMRTWREPARKLDYIIAAAPDEKRSPGGACNHRLDVLVKHDKYQEALSLSLSFYEGKAKAVIGLSGGSQRRKLLVSEKMLTLLDDFVDLSMTTLCPRHGRVDELEDHYQMVIPVCVEYCLKLKRTDMLFGNIYERFSADPIAQSVFLECLEPYILNDELTSITPSVMKDFVDHYESKGLAQNVEGCIVHMDIASLDIHQVVSLCWETGLYDAILYIYNRGMLDYVTPLEDLLELLQIAVNGTKQLTDQEVKLGNKLLVYISCCLAGRAYPLGDIPSDHASKVKDDVFKCISCLHTKKAEYSEPVYPYLKALLKFDTREFFNVLALAFEEPEFKEEQGDENKQRIVDILLHIMVESTGFTPTQVGVLFTFLARQMARPDNTIIVNRMLFEQVLESLCVTCDGDEARQEERQQALLELLHAGGLQHCDTAHLLTLAHTAQFYRVCEALYEKRREYHNILACYWEDTARQHQSFSYIESIMTSQHFSSEEKELVQQEAISHIKELCEIDSPQTARLVLVGLAVTLESVIQELQPHQETLFEFLQGVFEYRESSGSAIYCERQFQVAAETHELYIDLMCKRRPRSVLSHIKVVDGYRLEETLEICRKHKISDATAFLLEKAGDIQGAFNIIIESLQSGLADLVDTLQKDSSDTVQDLSVAWTSVQSVLLVLIQLCQRNSGQMDACQREALWFPLMDAVMSPQKKLKDQVDLEQLQDFKELTRHVLNSMMGYISLPSILQKIMQDPMYSTGRFGEMKDLLLGMLDTYNYEKTLLYTCTNLVNHDLHHQLAALTATARRGIVPRNEFCDICSKPYIGATETEGVICFRCGHGYHQPCLQSVSSFYKVDGDVVWTCYVCNKTRRHGNVEKGRLRLPSSSSTSLIKGSRIGGIGQEQSLLTPEHIQAIDNLRRVQKTQSRLAILTDLAKRERAGGSSKYLPSSSSLLHNDTFQLRLSHPIPDFT